MQQERTRTIRDLGRELERLRARRDADLQQLRWRVMATEAEPAFSVGEANTVQSRSYSLSPNSS